MGAQAGGLSAPTFGSRDVWWQPARSAASGSRWSYRLLVLFVLLLFANLPLLFPALEPLQPAQWVAVAALVLVFVELSTSGRALRLAWPESHLLLLFVGAAAISSFTALWPRYAGEQTLVLLRYVVVYVILVNAVDTWARLRGISIALAVGGLLPALGALRGYYWTGDVVEGRASWIGIFDNPNDLAYSLVLLFPIAAAATLQARGAWAILGWAGLGVYAAAIFLTFSRGGLVAFCVVALLCLLRWSGPWARVPALLFLGAALAFVVTRSWGRLEGFADLLADATLQQRFDTVRAGLGMFADRPLLGVGLGCSVIGWPLYAPPGAATEGWLHSHNTLIQALAETGLFGAAPFLLMVGYGLWAARRLARSWRGAGNPAAWRSLSALEISIWGFLVCGLAGGHVLSWFPYLVLGLISAARFLPGPAARGVGP